MKYDIKKLTSPEYLDLVNREENPDTDQLEIKYCKLGDEYFAYANCSIGKLVSPKFNKNNLSDKEIEAYFDQATEDITKEYNIRSTSLVKSPNFIKNPLTPGL